MPCGFSLPGRGKTRISLCTCVLERLWLGKEMS